MKGTFKLLMTAVLTTLLFACGQDNKESRDANENPRSGTAVQANDRAKIISMLDSFNTAAARADYKAYFNYFTEDAVFIGTDATENWDKKSFMAWAKPYFDKGTTWNFRSIDRHIYFDKSGYLAWFDELLDTQMKICRGSGVVVKQDNEWKVQQYVLSMTIPNSLSDTIVKIKAPIEDPVIKGLSGK